MGKTQSRPFLRLTEKRFCKRPNRLSDGGGGTQQNTREKQEYEKEAIPRQYQEVDTRDSIGRTPLSHFAVVGKIYSILSYSALP